MNFPAAERKVQWLTGLSKPAGLLAIKEVLVMMVMAMVMAMVLAMMKVMTSSNRVHAAMKQVN